MNSNFEPLSTTNLKDSVSRNVTSQHVSSTYLQTGNLRPGGSLLLPRRPAVTLKGVDPGVGVPSTVGLASDH